MKKMNFILLFLFAAFTVANAQLPKVKQQILGHGIPASPKQIAYTQPDGSIVHIFMKGDAAIHWAVTTDGYTLLSNPNGFYEYATRDNNSNLVSTGIVASDEANRTTSEANFLQTIQKGINYSETQIKNKIATFRNSKGKNFETKEFPSIGTHNFIVLLVGFPDNTFSNSVQDFCNLMNQENYNGTGSFKDYHFQNSCGNLTVNTTVAGVYVAESNHDYYGQNNGNGDDLYVEDLVSEAILAADADVDFSQFDNNSDGVVDALYIVYAGTGEASSGVPTDIWPHASSITPITVDGVSVEKYACSNELNPSQMMVGIGTICHEFGHSLGLPDYYDTDYAGSGGEGEGTGYWDCMASGAYNADESLPASHNSISKQLLGWQTPTTINTNDNFSFSAATQGTPAFLIEETVSNEGFYFENRQLEGFDAALNGHGMLIYHVDYDYAEEHLASNDINVVPDHQGVDIEEADGTTTDESGDTFPGLTSNTSFTDDTTPNSMLWNGQNLDLPIENIVENDGVIEFSVSGFSGVNEIMNNGVKVYPTLAKNYINITSSENIESISVCNSQGQIVIENQINTKNTRLDVANLKAGVYFVKTKINDKTTVSKVVVEN